MESKYYEYGPNDDIFRVDKDDEGRYDVFMLKDGKWVNAPGPILVTLHYEGYRLSPDQVPHAENS